MVRLSNIAKILFKSRYNDHSDNATVFFIQINKPSSKEGVMALEGPL